MGLKGDTGAQGPQGVAGSKGATGEQGPAGPAADTSSLQQEIDALEQQIDGLGHPTTPTSSGTASGSGSNLDAATLAGLQVQVAQLQQQEADLANNVNQNTVATSDALDSLKNQVGQQAQQLSEQASSIHALQSNLTDTKATLKDYVDSTYGTLADSLDATDTAVDSLGVQVAQKRNSDAQKTQFQNQADQQTLAGIQSGAVAGIVGAIPIIGPLSIPFTVMSAGQQATALLLSKQAHDPADPNFTVVAPPDPPAVATVTVGPGIPQPVADALNAVIANLSQTIGVSRAIGRTVDRSQGAANAGNSAWEQVQVAAGSQFLQQEATLVAAGPALSANLQSALQAAGLPTSVSASSAQAYASSIAQQGLPTAVVQALGQFGLSTVDISTVAQQDSAEAARIDPKGPALQLYDPASPGIAQAASAAMAPGMLTTLTGAVAGDPNTAAQVAGFTNDPSPGFSGTAPPGYIVTVSAESVGGIAKTKIGSAVAAANGIWDFGSSPLVDGHYLIIASATDPAGTTTQGRDLGPLTVDTAGPRVVGEVYDPQAKTVSVTLRDDLSGLDLSSVASVAPMGSTRKSGGPRPLFTTVSLPATPARPDDPETVVYRLNRGQFDAKMRATLIAGLLHVTDEAGNHLEDPILVTVATPARHATIAKAGPTRPTHVNKSTK